MRISRMGVGRREEMRAKSSTVGVFTYLLGCGGVTSGHSEQLQMYLKNRRDLYQREEF